MRIRAKYSEKSRVFKFYKFIIFWIQSGERRKSELGKIGNEIR